MENKYEPKMAMPGIYNIATMAYLNMYRMYFSQMVLEELQMVFVEPVAMDVDVEVDHHWMDYLDAIYEW